MLINTSFKIKNTLQFNVDGMTGLTKGKRSTVQMANTQCTNIQGYKI